MVSDRGSQLALTPYWPLQTRTPCPRGSHTQNTCLIQSDDLRACWIMARLCLAATRSCNKHTLSKTDWTWYIFHVTMYTKAWLWLQWIPTNMSSKVTDTYVDYWTLVLYFQFCSEIKSILGGLWTILSGGFQSVFNTVKILRMHQL